MTGNKRTVWNERRGENVVCVCVLFALSAFEWNIMK